MKLRDIYRSTKPAFSFEFFPPKTEAGERTLFEQIEILRTLRPSFFSMTYGAGGSTRDKTISLGQKIREISGVETVCHLTCSGQSRDEIRAVIGEIQAHGMENVMALRGDPPRDQIDWKPHPEGFRYAVDLVRAIREIGDFSIAVAGFPEVHPEAISRESDLNFLKQKVEAGADVVVTQLFFDNEDFFRFERDVKALGIKVPIVPGIAPITSAAQIRRLTTLSKARVPPKLDRALKRVENDDSAAREFGIQYTAEQIQGLLDHGVAGVHLYCLNRAAACKAIFEKLGLI